VACAANGRQALDLLRSGERPSCILLDLMLPVLDGWQFRREQQRDPALADIPVVMVSTADRAACLRTSGHVRKPFQPEELLAAIRAVA
jgi:CheY-like chemotaxis protein